MGGIFVSYRRGDSDGQARALVQTLGGIVGKRAVFIDVDSIALGRDFRQVLQERLDACDLMLALIGKEWLNAKDRSGNRRLDDPNDYVCQEIAAALKRNIPVTPVLLQGAQMPVSDELPSNIRDLAFRNGMELSHNRWESDVNEMVSRLNLRRRTRQSAPYWPIGIGLAAVVLLVGVFTIAFRQPVNLRPASSDALKSNNSERGGSTVATLSRVMSPLMEGHGYLGGTDYRSALVASATECSELCASETQCEAMTFDTTTRTCWLKNELTKMADSPVMILARKIHLQP